MTPKENNVPMGKYPCSREWTEQECHDVKHEINALIWKYAPEQMTLGDAETLAQEIWQSVRDGLLVGSAEQMPGKAANAPGERPEATK